MAEDDWLRWASIALSILLLAAYELYQARVARRDPAAVARSANRLLRADWVAALSRTKGTELLAVQTLRNSLMSATIAASTAALALMGSLTLSIARAGPVGSEPGSHWLSTRVTLNVSLIAVLFAAYVCSLAAIRLYHHASFVMALPVGSPERESRLSLVSRYLQRAGVLYGWGLRCFLLVAPMVFGLVHPFLMPFTTVGLLLLLRALDRGPASE